MDSKFRFDVPLYTVAEAARTVGVPATTFATWAKGYVRHPQGRRQVRGLAVVKSIDSGQGEPSIPFVGLAEGLVLAAVRRSGVPMQRVRPALAALEGELGVAHALASRRLYTDGAEVLFDYGQLHAERSEIIGQLVVVRNGQRVFTEVIADYLRRIEYSDDGYASLIRLPAYAGEVICDPTRSYGRPIFVRGGAKVDDVLSRFQAGESLDELRAEFGVTEADLEDALRVASRRAA